MAYDYKKMFNVSGKHAIVTGGAQGLSRGMAEGLLENGCKVVLVDIQKEKLEAVCEEYRAMGYEAYEVCGNLSDRADVDRIFTEAMEILDGKLDVLIPAAGVQRRHLPEEFPIEEWDLVLNINLNAVFLMIQKALKGAVSQLTKSLAVDCAGRNININCICPGYMDTEMCANMTQERKDECTVRIPAGRWGTPEDLKGPVLFLASSASDYLNGTTIPVDGGYLVK